MEKFKFQPIIFDSLLDTVSHKMCRLVGPTRSNIFAMQISSRCFTVIQYRTIKVSEFNVNCTCAKWVRRAGLHIRRERTRKPVQSIIFLSFREQKLGCLFVTGSLQLINALSITRSMLCGAKLWRSG